MSNKDIPAGVVQQKLRDIVGYENVLIDEQREFFCTDVYERKDLPIAVVRPDSVDEAQKVIAYAYGNQIDIVPRGGGASYTAGYLPISKKSILIDSGRLNRIVEINEEDMFVTVEPGVTWAQLDEVLRARGLRTPFRGPFSGLVASVGGTISQNAVGIGAHTWGVSGESVLAMKVIADNGRMLMTGQAGSAMGIPFFRFYGPDLTGLFTGDCGALGYKAYITLKLIRSRKYSGCLSFGFDSFDKIADALTATAGHVIEERSFALDAALQQGQIGKKDSSIDKIAIARSVLSDADNPVRGLFRVVKMGLAGERILKIYPYTAHYLFDGHSPGEVRGKARLLKKIARQFGKEIPNTVPIVVQAIPFAPLHNILGPNGERWVPIHGILPNSLVKTFHSEFQGYLASIKEELERADVYVGLIFSPFGSGAFLYEPAFYWKDQQSIFHQKMLDEGYARSLPTYPENPLGAQLVKTIRQVLVDQFHRYSAGHLQVGKYYPLLKNRDPAAVELLMAIKKTVDPSNLFNPGALGL